MNKYKLIAKFGAVMAIFCILFLPFVGCGGQNLTGLDVMQNERIGADIKFFIIASIACGVLIIFLKNYIISAIIAVGGIVSLLIAYFIAHSKIDAIELKTGAFLAITGYVITVIASFLKQSDRSNKTGSQSEVNNKNHDLSALTKKCPNCAEIIKLEAKICRYCQYKFSEEEVNQQISQVVQKEITTTSSLNINQIILLYFNKTVDYLRNKSKKSWRIIIIIWSILTGFLGILGIIIGLFGGIIGFFIWKPVDKIFAKKLLKISAIICGSWVIGITIVYFGYNYYQEQQYLKQMEQQKIDDEIAGDTDTPFAGEIPSSTSSTNTSSITGIYPQTSQRILTSSELAGLSKWELKVMRNEIFARHGYIFKTAEMKNYFSKQSWYSPMYSDVNSKITDIERKNIELIKKYE